MPGRNMDLSEGVGRKRNADDDSDSDDANFKRPRPAGNAEHDTKAIDSDDEDIDEKASTEKYDILQDDDVEGEFESLRKIFRLSIRFLFHSFVWITTRRQSSSAHMSFSCRRSRRRNLQSG